MEDMEKRLFDVQSQALASTLELKNRDESQRKAKEEMEDLGQKIRQSEAKQDSDSLLKYQKEYADLAKKLSTLE